MISVIVVGVGVTVGPKIRAAYEANAELVKSKIEAAFSPYGTDVWNAIRDKFIRNADEIFAAYPNILNLSTDIKNKLKDLPLSSDATALQQFNDDIGDAASDLFMYFDEAADALEGQVKAWKVLVDYPALRIKVDRLDDVSKFLTKNPGTENAIKQGLDDVGDYTDEFLNGIKNATDDLSHLNGRSALPNEIASAVNRIKQHRIDINKLSSGNFGYLEGNINGNAIDNKIWGSGPADLNTEPQIFNAIEVGGWVRNTDAEYKMLH